MATSSERFDPRQARIAPLTPGTTEYKENMAAIARMVDGFIDDHDIKNVPSELMHSFKLEAKKELHQLLARPIEKFCLGETSLSSFEDSIMPAIKIAIETVFTQFASKIKALRATPVTKSPTPSSSRHVENLIRYYEQKIETHHSAPFIPALRQAYAPEFVRLRGGEINTTEFASDEMQNNILENAKRIFARGLAPESKSPSGTALAMRGLSGSPVRLPEPSAPEYNSDDEKDQSGLPVSHTARTAPPSPDTSPEHGHTPPGGLALKSGEDSPPQSDPILAWNFPAVDQEKLRQARSRLAAIEIREREEAEAERKAEVERLRKEAELAAFLEREKKKKSKCIIM